ncbi:hypothetical protein CISG_04151 [Coccidioides immitis RMSCC 3703]|uniref:Uncharacterized protein n=2 Tax=Coccidioides immitis TaxID=5501 RepID=A0A0J8QVA3_COCIT|nr:hypothetical protein CIRG_06590 [Coccidioides immitis RMSCC 2394]KMU75203.1 hypothetical protein CISG_04151 [Coccidioides immitis RMSCC 3703]
MISRLGGQKLGSTGVLHMSELSTGQCFSPIHLHSREEFYSGYNWATSQLTTGSNQPLANVCIFAEVRSAIGVCCPPHKRARKVVALFGLLTRIHPIGELIDGNRRETIPRVALSAQIDSAAKSDRKSPNSWLCHVIHGRCPKSKTRGRNKMMLGSLLRVNDGCILSETST